MYRFSLNAFNIFFLSLIFWHLIATCLGVIFFGFSCSLYVYGFITCIRFGKILAFFSYPFPLLSEWDPNYLYVILIVIFFLSVFFPVCISNGGLPFFWLQVDESFFCRASSALVFTSEFFNLDALLFSFKSSLPFFF